MSRTNQAAAVAAMLAAFSSRDEAIAALRAAYPTRELPADLTTFAAMVNAATAATAEEPGASMPGMRQVWISHVIAAMVADGYGVDGIKARLVDAHRAGLLSMSRCDLAGAFDARVQAESEVAYMSATWHFLRG